MTARLRDRLSPELRDRYGDAVSAVMDQFACLEPSVVDNFCEQLLIACENARLWKPETDDNKQRQERDVAFNEEARRQAPHLRSFAALCRRYPDQTGRVLLRIFQDGTMGHQKGFGIGPQHKALARLLETLAAELERPGGVKSGGWVHRSTVANLDFNQPIDSRLRAEMPETALLFELVLRFRLFTATGEPPLLQRGQPMPPSDQRRYQPRYKLVCEFMQAALGCSTTEGEAKNRLFALLKRNPRIEWVPWPKFSTGQSTGKRISLNFGTNWSARVIITEKSQ